MTEQQANQININDYVDSKAVCEMFNFLMTCLEKEYIKQSQAMNMLKLLNKKAFREPLDDVKPAIETIEEKEVQEVKDAEPSTVFEQTESVSNYVTDNTCNPF